MSGGARLPLKPEALLVRSTLMNERSDPTHEPLQDTRAQQLAVAENLARVYRDVLGHPVPDDLARLLARLRRR